MEGSDRKKTRKLNELKNAWKKKIAVFPVYEYNCKKSILDIKVNAWMKVTRNNFFFRDIDLKFSYPYILVDHFKLKLLDPTELIVLTSKV